MSISLQLGYTNEDQDPDLTGARCAKTNDLIAQLDAIEGALASARLNSIAVQVEKLTVDYAKHIALLKAKGARLLKELANISELEVVYDRLYGIG